MKNSKAVTYIFYALIILCAIQIYYCYNFLPEKVASHFNIKGEPDAWSSKEAFATFQMILLIFLAIIFGGIAKLLHKIPDYMLNFPNKKYWLAPERRKATLIYCQNYLLKVGVATVLLIASIFQITYQASINGSNLGSSFWVMFILYMLWVLISTYKFIKSFYKIKET